ncbi:TROVE domain-containing protein [Granulicella mallensis]|uniref:TROVE domain-containing protein n=1 Tax=Granulicella mallensis (strain ATCC BAA-1857 / DSM 23137 / MP5ACTX8) TaxID=682795 RepID=G8NXS7_GRAMM|nr:TROVE domain-containing protein [Granulicella mallensis]AEU34422.1 TROVE domain-containing protein [Granulicella mallensis MP5ACTX8]
MKLNILKFAHLARPRTHEGAPAVAITPELALRRSVLACMLWENEFYEDGVAIAGRIRELVPKVAAEKVAALAVEARTAMKLRHAPLLLVREMARHATHRAFVAETLARVIQRADELAEFVAIYWADGRAPLSGQVKKGLAAAFPKFDEYALAKYDRAGVVRLRDVLFLCHAKPRDAEQAAVWKRLVDGELATPDTWEVALSASAGDKRAHWERLLAENKLGALALLRNLRNMKAAGVDEKLVVSALGTMKTDRVLPFRFLAAARYAPQWEEELEAAMFRAVAEREKLVGHTVLLVDVSGSMVVPLSRRSEMLRTDAAYGLAVLLREIAEKVSVYTFSVGAVRVPPRRGFALRDAMEASQPHGGTNLGAALEAVKEKYDRILVITDEQSHDRVPAPKGRGYVINVASARNGVGYGAWSHIDGWSEAVIEYVRELERAE